MSYNTFDIDNVEIFETGKWNGDVYTEQDLDDMVKAFGETKDALKPHVKLGHDENQTLLQKDGYPSAGWITDIKRNGKKLLAKIEGVPEKIHDLIKSKAYGRVSSEIFWNLNLDGKKHRRALKAISLLGGNTPEVHSLDDFITLYTENFDAETKIYTEKEIDMDKEKIQEIENQLKEYKQLLEDIKSENDNIKKENEELKLHAKQVEHDKKVSEITSYFDKAIDEGKITPAQYDSFVALSIDEGQVKTYTNKKNEKTEGNAFELIKQILGNAEKQVDFSEQSQHKEVEHKKSEDDELHDKIAKYAKENNVTYAQAFDIISYEEV